MSKHPLLFYLAITLLLLGCEGSDFYQGQWKALRYDGSKATITFSPKSVIFDNDSLGLNEFTYKQVSIQLENENKTYGVKLDNGDIFYLLFPESSTPKKGGIVTPDGALLYTIGEDQYYEPEDVWGLKFMISTLNEL